MFHREKEGPVFDVHKENAAPHRFGKSLLDTPETLPLPQSGIDGLGNEMGKNRIDFFHIIIIASLLAGLCGCGHKAPPYYPKEKSQSRSS
jgi:hypothetical protein